MIVTIDGPSGTGKSTVARKVAERLRFVYFDTGAMYRAFTWVLMEHNTDVHDLRAVEGRLRDFQFQIEEAKEGKRYFVNSVDVTEIIRSRPVTARVSEVSAVREVREALLGVQRRFAKTQNAVFEGRDLGTVVFPEAEVKVFLTADPQVRAERRYLELLAKTPEETRALDKEKLLIEMIERDRYDSSREVAPLKCPPGAFVLDTSALSVEEVTDQVVDFVKTQVSL